MTFVVPTGKRLPDGTPLRTTVALPQLSLALAVPSTESETKAAHEVAPAPVIMLTAGGATTVGATSSMTVIVCDALAVLPAASVAVSVRVRISGLAGEPAPPLLVSLTVTTGAPQLSEAAASELFPAGTWLAH
jgi:hypothetical protein